MTKRKDPNLRSQATAIFIGSIVGTIFQFLIPALLVRIISKEDFGIFRQFQLLSGTLVAFLGMGYRSSLFYFYPTSDESGKKRIIQQTQWLFIVNLFIFTIFYSFYGEKLLEYLNFSFFLEYKYFVLAFVWFTLLSSVIEIIFTLEKNNLANKVFPSIRKIARFLTFVIVIWIYQGAKGAIYAQVLFSLALLVFFVWHTRQYYRPFFAPNKRMLIDQLYYSLPFGLALILNLISKTFDKFFVNQYISPSDFAIYSISFLSIPILNQFFQSVHNVVVPEISLNAASGKMEAATKLWQKTVEKTSSVAIPAVFIFWVLANEIITVLYTEKYLDAVPLYRIFISMFFVSMFSHELILRGANKTKYIFYSNLVSTIVTVVLGFVLIPVYNLNGAIFVALAGTVLPMIISLLIEKRIMNLSFYEWVDWKKLVQKFIICATISVPIVFVKDLIPNLFIRATLVVLVFGLWVVLFQLKMGLFIFKQELLNLKKRFS